VLSPVSTTRVDGPNNSASGNARPSTRVVDGWWKPRSPVN